VSAFFALTACAQNTPKPQTEPAKPEVKKPETPDAYKLFQIVGSSEHNFGKIDQDQSVEHTFIFKNNSNETITIENAKASCGCTGTVISEKAVKPGAEGKILVKFTPPKGTRGSVQKTVSVYLKGETSPHTVLRFSAEVRTDLDIQPPFIQMLGAIAGQPVSGKATLKNVSTEPIEIKEFPPNVTLYVDTSVVTSSNPGGSIAEPLKDVTVTPSSLKLQPGESKDLIITLVPQKRGQINGMIRIKTPKSEALLTVYGIVRAKTN
jgi:uncharacterized cupredoxin-like copper-binding protein